MNSNDIKTQPEDFRDRVLPVPRPGEVRAIMAARLDDGRLFELSIVGAREDLPALVDTVARQFAAWARKETT